MERLPKDVQWLIFGPLVLYEYGNEPARNPLSLCPHVHVKSGLRFIAPRLDGHLAARIADWCLAWPCLVPMFKARAFRLRPRGRSPRLKNLEEFTFVPGSFSWDTLQRLQFPMDYETKRDEYKCMWPK